LVEVGCGAGGNLLELLQLGFHPQNLLGLELLPERLALARERLPLAVQLRLGDACLADVTPASQDLVLLSTVLSSILEPAAQQALAQALWRWLKRGGMVICYDFVFNNPANADVCAVPLQRLRTLFPEGRIQSQRLTLAPPLARSLCRLHPGLYTLFNALPLLRTHRLTCIVKI
jgi:SAM-dependent methyltransferase